MKSLLKFWPFLFILVGHWILLQSITFTAWPEMLSYPYLISQGFTFYKDVVIPYPPLLIILLEYYFKFAGFSPLSLQWFTWCELLVTDLIIGLCFIQVLKNIKLSFLALAAYVVCQSVLDGNMLWFDIFLVFPLSIMVLAMLRWMNTQNRIWLGIVVVSFLMATMIKQTAILYGLPILFIYYKTAKKSILNDGLMSLVLLILTWGTLLTVLLFQGSLTDFWRWNFWYPLTSWSKFPGYVDFQITRKQSLILISLTTILGTSLLGRWRLLHSSQFWFFMISLVIALLSVYPRFSFFHLQPALFFTFILIVESLSFLKPTQKYGVIIGVILVSLVIVGLQWKFVYHSGELRFRNDGQIQSLVRPGQTIFLLGPYSSNYVYSATLPPKPWVDTFGWYQEIPGVQEEVLRGWSMQKPELIVWQQPMPGEWYQLGSYQPQQLVSFMKQHYVQSKELGNGLTVWIPKLSK